MAHNDPPKTLGEAIDELERIQLLSCCAFSFAATFSSIRKARSCVVERKVFLTRRLR